MDATTKAPSPFLPGTTIQYAWDSTSLGYLKTCPRLYYYQMIEGYTPREDSIHLRFGIEYHKALEEYEILRADATPFEEAMREVVHNTLVRTAEWEENPDSKAGRYKSREALIRTIIWYLDEYKDDPAKTLIKSDGTPAVELSFRFETDLWATDHQPYLLAGHLDKVVSYNDELFGMDHKTTTITPGDYYFSQYAPNNQMTLYTLATKIVFGAPIRGMIIDVAQLMVDSSRFVRGFTYRTNEQLDEWVADLSYWFGLAKSYADSGYWPMNDTACSNYGGCRFRDICSKSPGIRERFLLSGYERKSEEERWNPLKVR